MLTSTFSKDLIVLKVLDLSRTRCHQDVTIVCSNGTVNSNSFLLASIFPVVRRALETTIQYQDPVLILIPDMDIIELQTFLLHLREHHSMMNISKDLKDSSPNATGISTEQERVSSLRPVHISPALLSPGGCRLSTVKI